MLSGQEWAGLGAATRRYWVLKRRLAVAMHAMDRQVDAVEKMRALCDRWHAWCDRTRAWEAAYSERRSWSCNP